MTRHDTTRQTLLMRPLILISTLSSFADVDETANNNEEIDGDDNTLTAYACEGESLRMRCPQQQKDEKKVLEVVRANFGRFSIAVCNDHVRTNLSVNCIARETLGMLQNR